MALHEAAYDLQFVGDLFRTKSGGWGCVSGQMTLGGTGKTPREALINFAEAIAALVENAIDHEDPRIIRNQFTFLGGTLLKENLYNAEVVEK